MQIEQSHLCLAPKKRGVHLVTQEIMAQLPWLPIFQKGILHLFLQHTSAALALNENADDQVREDAERFFQAMIPDGWEGFSHTLEGPDDMPAHMRSIMVGVSVTVPIVEGRMALGMWQGLYLIEGRQEATARHIIVTAMGR